MAKLLAFLRTTTGLLTAIAALIGAVATLVGLYQHYAYPPAPPQAATQLVNQTPPVGQAARTGADAPPPATGKAAQVAAASAPPASAPPAAVLSDVPAAKPDAVFSSGQMTLRASFPADLDLGVEITGLPNADVWWDQHGAKNTLTPERAKFAYVGQQDFDALSLARIKLLPFSYDGIRADNDTSNLIPDGTVLAYRTKQGRFGKLLIVRYGTDLQLKWVTYSGS